MEKEFDFSDAEAHALNLMQWRVLLRDAFHGSVRPFLKVFGEERRLNKITRETQEAITKGFYEDIRSYRKK